MEMRRERRRGFTLIEVLLVILILGMLATVFIIAVGGTRERARKETTMLKLKAIENALETYNMHVGNYPTEEQGGLQALRIKPTFEDEKTAEKWSGPYLREDPLDAWGHPFNYTLLDASQATELGVPFKLWSDGPDGQDGTDDDIRNWQEAT